MLQMFTGNMVCRPRRWHRLPASAGGLPVKVRRDAQEDAPLRTLSILLTFSSAFATIVITVLVTYSRARADAGPEQDR